MVVSERPMEPLDLGVFESTGVDPRRFDYLILKSRMYCRPSFVPLSSGLVECDSRGVTSSDYALFPFRRCAGRSTRSTASCRATAAAGRGG